MKRNTTTLKLPSSVALAANSRGLHLTNAKSSDLEDLFHGIIAVQEMTPWVMGDLLIEIERRLSDKHDEAIAARYRALLQSARDHGYSGADLFVCKAVCGYIPVDDRRPALPYALHCDVIAELQNKRSLNRPAIVRWLDYCENELPDERGQRRRSALRIKMRGETKAGGIDNSPPIPSLNSIMRPFRLFRASLPSQLTREDRREILTGLREIVDFYREIERLEPNSRPLKLN